MISKYHLNPSKETLENQRTLRLEEDAPTKTKTVSERDELKKWSPPMPLRERDREMGMK